MITGVKQIKLRETSKYIQRPTHSSEFSISTPKNNSPYLSPKSHPPHDPKQIIFPRKYHHTSIREFYDFPTKSRFKECDTCKMVFFLVFWSDPEKIIDFPTCLTSISDHRSLYHKTCHQFLGLTIPY